MSLIYGGDRQVGTAVVNGGEKKVQQRRRERKKKKKTVNGDWLKCVIDSL